MKTIKTQLFTLLLLTLSLFMACNSNAQSESENALIGTWEKQSNLKSDDCETDHSVFAADHTAKEIRYDKNCQAKENTFNWKLDDNLLTLTKGEKSVNWLIQSIDENEMTVGVQMRPGSENRMYVIYKKRD